MNPQKDYGSFDTTTTRAAITLFRRCGDQFQFSVDGTSDEEEVRGYIYRYYRQSDSGYKQLCDLAVVPEVFHDSRDLAGKTAIGITSINKQDNFNILIDTIKELGLTVDTEQST